jgi:hypothetical protein
MKFLAWDVGIKNLAYSIIDYNMEEKTKEIIGWGVINLMNELVEKPKDVLLCCESNQKGKKCTSKALFLFQNNPSEGICKMHRSMTKYKPCRFLDLSQPITCCYTINNKKTNINTICGKNALTSRKDNINITYCNAHLKVMQKKEAFETFEIKKEKKELVRTMSVLLLATRLYEHLDNLKDTLLDVDEIIIENQPVLKNPTMKTVQILLYSYFVMNGIMKEKVKNIHFFSASKKLEAFDDVDGKIMKTLSHLSGQYQVNKKAAILFTQEMIKKNTKWFNFFNTHHKKDDLADAYLTNCYFIDRHFKQKLKKDGKLKQKDNDEQTNLELNEENIEDVDDNESIKEEINLYSDDDNDMEDRQENVDTDSDIDLDLYFGKKIIDTETSKKIVEEEVKENMKTEAQNKKQFYKYYKKTKPSSAPISNTNVKNIKPQQSKPDNKIQKFGNIDSFFK